MDLEETVVDEIRSGSYRDLFHPGWTQIIQIKFFNVYQAPVQLNCTFDSIF